MNPAAESTGTPTLQMTDAVVRYGGTTALDHVSFSLASGESVALLGRNGSGKTTLVRALLGLVPLASGSVRLFGAPLRSFRDWGRVGYAPQRHTATAGVPATVTEVVLSGRMGRRGLVGGWRRSDREAAVRALEAVALADRATAPVSALSGGQQQRVLVARALAGEPDVLVLDEPTAGMDADSEARLAATMSAFRRRGGSLLVVSHELGALTQVIQRVVVCEDGRVSYDGAPGPGLEEAGHVHHRHEHEHPHRQDRVRHRPGGAP